MKTAVAAGLHSLLTDRVRPTYFDQNVLGKAKRIADRVTNGLAETVIEWGDEAESFSLTPTAAGLMASNAAAVLKPKMRPYSERGTLEGFHDGVLPGNTGKPELYVRRRRTGERVKCILTPEAAADIRHREIEEVLAGRRLQVRGTLHYKAAHHLDHVTAEHVRVMPRKEDLPTLDQIIDPNFTDGLSTEEYLEAVRNAQLS